jgi:hypothetical protein
MFRGDAIHSGRYAAPAPAQFHRVKWKFPSRDRVISSPVFKDNVIYSEAMTEMCTRLMLRLVAKFETSDERASSRDAGDRGRHALRWELRRKVLRIQCADRRVK